MARKQSAQQDTRQQVEDVLGELLADFEAGCKQGPEPCFEAFVCMMRAFLGFYVCVFVFVWSSECILNGGQ